jgi:hypothetical protein
MTITGGIKFFELSKALLSEGATAVASSGTQSDQYSIDGNLSTGWTSSGSDDTTAETITITFQAAATISRILLLSHNWDTYTITPITSPYLLDEDGDELEDEDGDFLEDSGSTLEFLNVISLTSSVAATGISESGYSLTSSYYEFDPVYCTGLTITVTVAQTANDVADQEKQIAWIVPTYEVNSTDINTSGGTFQGYPRLTGQNNFQSNNLVNLKGLGSTQKLTRVFRATLDLIDHPNQNDITLAEHLINRQGAFYIWPNGGVRTDLTTNFRRTIEGYGLTDLFKVQVSSASMGSYRNGIYIGPVNQRLQFTQEN